MSTVITIKDRNVYYAGKVVGEVVGDVTQDKTGIKAIIKITEPRARRLFTGNAMSLSLEV